MMSLIKAKILSGLLLGLTITGGALIAAMQTDSGLNWEAALMSGITGLVAAMKDWKAALDEHIQNKRNSI